MEVKANSKQFQKAKKQLFDGKDRLEEVFTSIDLKGWNFIGVFYAQSGEEPFVCSENNCSTYAIIGESSIAEKLKMIEENAAKANNNWKAKDHVDEFIELFMQLVFIAQGNPYAPVTGSAIIKKTSKSIEKAGALDNIFFWTPDQLVVAEAIEKDFVFLDAFYSTGKTVLLKYRASTLAKKNKNMTDKAGKVYYFVNSFNDRNKLPFTLVMEHEFRKLDVIVCFCF